MAITLMAACWWCFFIDSSHQNVVPKVTIFSYPFSFPASNELIRWTSTHAEIDGTPRQHRAYRAISGTPARRMGMALGTSVSAARSPW